MTSPIGDFTWVPSSTDRRMYEDMYAAITEAKAWSEMKHANCSNGEDPTLIRIQAVLKDSIGHSSATMSHTIQRMKHLATVGWETWVKIELAAYTRYDESYSYFA